MKNFAPLAGVRRQVLELLVLLLKQSGRLLHQCVGGFDLRVLFMQFYFRRFDLAAAAIDPLLQLHGMFFVELDPVTKGCDLIFELLHLGPRARDLFVRGVESAARSGQAGFAIINLIARRLLGFRNPRDLAGAFAEFLLEALQFAV